MPDGFARRVSSMVGGHQYDEPAEVDDYAALERKLDQSYERAARFVRTALDQDRALHADWRKALADVITDVDRIVRRDAHPDDVSRARLIMDSLLGLWLSDDERDALFDDYALSPQAPPRIGE